MNLWDTGSRMGTFFQNERWAVFVVLFIFLALSWHMVHFDHHHPEFIFGESVLQGAMHGDNRKWLSDILAVSLLGFFSIVVTLGRIMLRAPISLVSFSQRLLCLGNSRIDHSFFRHMYRGKLQSLMYG